MDIPQLIIDLAIMLSTAAVVSIVFRKLKIPAILGYILAGFLTGPHFPMFLEVESTASVETWGEIGVVIILFHIGLEFDFHKINRMGSVPIVSAVVKMAGVMFAGFGFGKLIGLSGFDSLFLGAMLSISSTVVIKKCLDEMGLAKEKFSGLVIGSLVMEDVLAIFMMVILSTVSLSGGTSSVHVLTHLILMVCYLIIWLILGIFIVPTWLDKVIDLLSDEALTLLSLGFCFLMAVVANKLGFSMELGAFLAGSFFAGTNHVHKIENVTRGVKDVFGSIFFLSVGMMVEPSIIATKWFIILPVAIIAVVAKLIFAMLGMTLSGQNVDTSVRAGVALAPIGEFSFIIASLGMSLGVTSEYLYPVIVASSILTIIFTPILIKSSDKVVLLANKIIPEKLKSKINTYTVDVETETEKPEWSLVLKDYFSKIVIYGSIMLVTAVAGCELLVPALRPGFNERAARYIATIAIYIIMVIFIGPFMRNKGDAFNKLWTEKVSSRPSLIVMVATKIAIIISIAYIPLRVLHNMPYGIAMVAILASIFAIAKFDFVTAYYTKLEKRFLDNLHHKKD